MSTRPIIKKRKTYQAKFTKYELLHLRDILSVVLPPDMKTTVSQALAEAENRSHIEHAVWTKISNLCKEAGLPIEDDAPDYIIAATNTPPLGVFQVSSDPPEGESIDAIKEIIENCEK